jgi:hypothetical protein
MAIHPFQYMGKGWLALGWIGFESNKMKKISALALLHPDGVAHTSFVLGGNCPEVLRPDLQKGSAGNTDLFILAPSRDEYSRKGWLEAAVQSMSQELSPDGIGYVFVPPLWRPSVLRLVRKAGLQMEASFRHLPDWPSSRSLVCIGRNTGQFAAAALMQAPAWKRILADQIHRYAGTRWLLIMLWPSTGLAVRRPGARPLFHWLFQGEGRPIEPGNGIVRGSWRGSNGAHLVYGFSRENPSPSVIAKTVAVDKAPLLKQEARVLQELSSSARQAGARVPVILGSQHGDRHSSLLLSFLPGRPASDLLALQPGRFFSMMNRIVAWLENWHRATVSIRPLERQQVEQTLLVPLDRLAPSIRGAEKYRDWLVRRCQEVVGNPAPLVAVHYDLTMANLLFDERGPFAVVDWETACRESWPLVDFYYAVTDAVRVTAGCPSWVEAFRTCFLSQGSFSARVAAWQTRLQSAVDLSPRIAELCFHACWLHHACNEQQANQPGKPRPFLEIVQWLATDDSRFTRD